jgi:GGDEF domain-containing protein
VTTSAVLQLRGESGGPFLYWTSVALVLLIVGRQLPTVLDNQTLNRRLAAMVGELEHQAFDDGLTNLANRALFRERVAHALRRRSQVGTPLALLFIDLDDFKTVNDQLGHAAGDDLLVDVAGRLKTCVRDEDTVARLGGEFAILLEQAPSHEVAVRVAGRILEARQGPLRAGLDLGLAGPDDHPRAPRWLSRAGRRTAAPSGPGRLPRRAIPGRRPR